MIFKRFTLVLALLALLTAGVSAGDDRGPRSYAVFGRWFSGPGVLLADPIVQEATGLEGEDLQAALQDGSSISELIAANDGEVESVIASLVAQATEAYPFAGLQATTAELGSGLQRGDGRQPPPASSPGGGGAIPCAQHFGAWGMDETDFGSDRFEPRQQLNNGAACEGATIAELDRMPMTAMSAATVSILVEQATAGIDEAAAARIRELRRSGDRSLRSRL